MGEVMNIIELAKQAGIEDAHFHAPHPGVISQLKSFAALVAAHEREECAKECEHTALRMGSEWMAHHCAQAIRTRGTT